MLNGTAEVDVPIFDPTLLQAVDFKEGKCSFRDNLSPTNPGDGLLMRPLNTGDYDKGFTKILEQLTVVGEVSREEFLDQFSTMKNCKDTYFITVLEDTTTSQIIGSGTLVIEQKFIHKVGSRGRIEDIVVSKDYRGKQLGKIIVETLTLLGKKMGCYKMSLECEHKNIKFYENFGYKKDEGNNFMVQRYKD